MNKIIKQGFNQLPNLYIIILSSWLANKIVILLKNKNNILKITLILVLGNKKIF